MAALTISAATSLQRSVKTEGHSASVISVLLDRLLTQRIAREEPTVLLRARGLLRERLAAAAFFQTVMRRLCGDLKQ